MNDLQEEDCKSPNFCEKLSSSLLQLYDEQKFCDFRVSVEKRVFKVHKVVMASVSEYFRAMLEHDMLENQKGLLELKSLSVAGVEPLIKFSYSGTMTLNLGNIYEVMNAATFLQIMPAVDCCVQYLKNKLTFENAEELLRIADLYSIPQLKSYYRKYILSNFLEFGLTDQFLHLDSETLADYLSDDALNTTSECILLHLVMNWYNHDPENRKDSAFEVFEKIRYVVDGWPAVQYAIHCEPFKTIPALKDLIQFADSYLGNYEKRFTFDSHRTRMRGTKKSLIQIGGEIKFSYDYRDDALDFPMLFRNDILGWHRNHYYDFDLKKWLPLGDAEIQAKLSSHAALTEVNGNAIMCGGYTYGVTETGLISKHVTKRTWLFTASDCRLRDMPSMKHPRVKHAAVFLQGCVYAIGGSDGIQKLCSVEKLSCGEDDKMSWSYVRGLSASLDAHAAVVCNKKIYISGGERRRGHLTNTVWCYCPVLNRWHKRKSMLKERSGHGMANINDTIYVLGGISGTYEILDTIETYNVDTDTWTKICTTLPLPVCFASTVVMDDKILLVGGKVTAEMESEDDGVDNIEMYDPKEDVWTSVGTLIRPLKFQSCCALTLKLTSKGEMETDEIYAKYAKIVNEDHHFELSNELDKFYNTIPEDS
ncbi:kelch-like protein 26 [Saccostrea echinata]|uniref:kelch-like protein 26 n=1 Tax=Saccostrea echinata TaxID=191078 RepID=UPI002A7FAF1B|nr:kelch-like protein 26 [Saccostrea echinata]